MKYKILLNGLFFLLVQTISASEQKISQLELIPIGTQRKIFSYLSPDDLFYMRCTNRYFLDSSIVVQRVKKDISERKYDPVCTTPPITDSPSQESLYEGLNYKRFYKYFFEDYFPISMFNFIDHQLSTTDNIEYTRQELSDLKNCINGTIAIHQNNFKLEHRCWIVAGISLEDLHSAFQLEKIKPARIIINDKKIFEEIINFIFLILASLDSQTTREPILLKILKNTLLQNEQRETPLHKACEAGILNRVRLLIQSNIKLHVRDNRGNTPLHIACLYNKLDIVKLLVQNGADVNIQNDCGETPLYCLDVTQALEVAKYLLECGANPNILNTSGKSLLHLKCMLSRKLDVMQFYINFVKLLIAYEANVNLQDEQGKTPLHYASSKVNMLDIVKLLVENGAGIDIQDNDGITPLHLAVIFDCVKTTEFLIESNVKLNVQDRNGETPLHHACSDPNLLGIAKLLVEHGAGLDIPDNKGDIPLYNSVI